MDLILWRHAQAEEGTPDEGRALTALGKKQAARMAACLDRILPEGTRILCSPTLRTRQTADALGRKYKTVAEIGPAARAEDILKAASWPDARNPVLVVGHQPWLGQVAALLLTGGEQDWTVRKANAWWTSHRQREEGNAIFLRAVLAPELLLE